MKLPSSREELYLFWCRLYIFLGLCSITAGIYVANIARGIEKDGRSTLEVVAATLVIVGFLRIANSLWVIRNIRRRFQQATPQGGKTGKKEQKT